MSSNPPSGGRPDHEEPNYPHGSKALDGTSLSVNGTTDLPNIPGFLEVGGYRSLVVQVKNLGTRDLTVTPQWDFYAGSVSIGSTEGQTVAAGTSKRLLFQNQGDIINRIRVTGGGAGDTIHYYVAPSNLDPLPRSGAPLLYLIQRTPAQSIPNNAGTLIEFGPTPGTRFYTNDASKFSFDLSGAGDINGVHILDQGEWDIYTRLTFASAGNYNKQVTLNAASSETNPIGNANEIDRTFDAFCDTLQTQTLLALAAGAAVAANNAVTVSGLQVSGGAINVDQATLYIVRRAAIFP